MPRVHSPVIPPVIDHPDNRRARKYYYNHQPTNRTSYMITTQIYDDQSYYVLMRNKAAYAKMLDVHGDELTFVKGYQAVYSDDRKRRDILIGRAGLEEFAPVRIYSGTVHARNHDWGHNPSFRNIGIQHYRCHDDKHLEYLLVSVPIYEETVDFVVCKKGDLFKIARHNKRMIICDLEIKKPIMEEKLIADVLKNTYLFVKNAKKIKQGGIRLRRGVIMDGPPGNGKTMLCAYIDNLCRRDGLTTKKVNSTQISRSYQEGKLEKLFWSADVIFFDDIDVGFLNRQNKGEIATNILTAMDGLETSKNCVVRVFTTNENIDDLDPAFTRPGRIDAKFRIDLPSEELRVSLIEQWPKELQGHIDKKKLIDLTEGLSFSQIEEIRSKMVINFYVEGEWNFDRALDEFNRFNQELKQKKTVGFGTKQ